MNQKLSNFLRGLVPALKRMGPGAAALWIPVIAFSAIANEVIEREPLPFDAPILNYLHSLATPALDRFVVFTTDFGGVVFILIASALLAALCYRFINRRAAYLVIIAAGGSAAINLLIKSLFQRQRPDLWEAIISEKTFSFPSGHSMASSALAFTVMSLLWNTRWRWLAVTLGAAYFIYIGLTRIYLGVHFPSDVLGGWCVSLIWVSLVSKALYRKPVRDDSTSA
jgi:membrane-associated phospholipid phosphatase